MKNYYKSLVKVFMLFSVIALFLSSPLYGQFGCNSGVVITNGYTQMGITTPGTGGVEDWNINPSGTSINSFYWDDDVYLFEYTAGATAENISMTIFTRKTWNGIGIFSDCTGTEFSNELDASGSSSSSNISQTVSANIAVGSTVYIAVGQWGTPNDLDFDVTDFTVTQILCADPVALNAINITSSSAELVWTEIGTATAWDIEWGVSEFVPTGSPNITETTTNPHLLGGLSPQTSYDFYVRASCGAGDYSDWVGPFTFETACSSQLAGSYTIGATGDYLTLSDAVSELNACGISGSVTFNVLPGSGPYNEQIAIVEISGASSSNTITLNGNGETLTSTTTSSDRHLILLDGTDYVTIVNFNLVTQSDTNNFPILLTNNADYNVITSNVVDMTSTLSSTGTTNAGILVSGSTTSATSTTGGSGTNNVIVGNTIIGGYYGINVNGQSATPSLNNIISNNTVKDFYSFGISLRYNNNSVVANNEVSRPDRSSVTTFNGIYLTSGGEGNVVSANNIHTPFGGITGTSTSANYGIYHSSIDAGIGNENTVINNIVHLTGNNGIIYALYNSGSDGVHYYHNTVVLDDVNATAGTTRGFYQTTTADNIDLKNNIFSITREGTGDKHCLYFNTPSSVIVSNNNVLYLNSSGGTNGIGYSGSNQVTLTDWQTATSGDMNSVDDNPLFVDSVSGNFMPTNPAVDNIGTPVGVTTDINGDSRDIVTPDVGAIEFDPPACTQPSDLTAINITAISAELGWTENGSAMTWDIEWGLEGFTPTGTPTISGTTTNPHPLSGLTEVTDYDYYVRADCGGGQSIWVGPYTFQTAVDCSVYTLSVTTTGGGVCDEGSATLSATAGGTGSDIFWYDAAVNGNLLGFGSTFDTPFINETTSFWAAEVLHGGNLPGQAFANPTTFSNSTSNAGGLLFNVASPIIIVDVEVFGTSATGGDVTIELRDIDNGNATIASTTATITGGGTTGEPIPHIVPLNFTVPAAGNYRLVRSAASASVGMGTVSSANSNFPYPLGSSGLVTGGSTLVGTSTTQFFFFNWTIIEAALCESTREEAIATVHETIPVEADATDLQINPGDSTTLNATSTNTNYTYEWTWDGGGPLAGASVVVSPANHTTYTVTATDTVTGCVDTDEITILVFDTTLCIPLDITSVNGGYVCDEGTTTLSATAAGTGDDIYWYDAQFDGNLVGIGSTYETPFLDETTSYWAAEVLLEVNFLTGQAFANPTTFGTSTANSGLLFYVDSPIYIVDVEVFGTNATSGDVTIELRDVNDNNTTIASTTASITGGGTTTTPIPHTVPLGFYVPEGSYRLVRTGATAAAGMGTVTSANSNFPYPLGDSGEVTGGATLTGTSVTQFYFFNWTIEEVLFLCESVREEVIATVVDIDEVNVTATQMSISPGGSTDLTASSTNTNYTYEWTWDGGNDTGATISVSPTVHTTYTVTATNSVTGCEAQAEITILVFDTTLCNPLDITATTGDTICSGETATLTATSGGTGDAIYWYDAEFDGNLVGEGTSFETPALTTTTSYWAAEVLIDGNQVNMGPLDPSIGTSSVSSLTNHGMFFTVLTPTVLVSVDIFPTAAVGTNSSILIRDGSSATGTIVATVPYITTVSGTTTNPVAQTVTLDVALQPGSYTMTPGIGINLIRNESGASYPYTSTVAEITGNTFNVNYWYWFYNWQFGEEFLLCESDREEAIATVTGDDAPLGDANQDFMAGETLADLDVTGTDLIWYEDDMGTIVIPDTTVLVDGVIYYVSQTINGCESQLLAITVTEIQPCDAPTALTLVAVTDTTVEISWTASATETGGYAWYVFADGDDPLTDPSLFDGTVATGITTVTVSGLDPETDYDFYAATLCDAGAESDLAGPLSFTTDVSGPAFPAPYCGPIVFTSGVEPITYVGVAGIANTSSAAIGGVAHEDFTSIVGSMEVGGSYSIALEGNTDGNYTNRFVVFIDWNQNDVLDDLDEVFEITQTITNSTGTDGQQAIGTISVPSGAILGQTRMRVKKIFGTTNYLDPCAGTGYGQVEDYTIDVLPSTIACLQPSGLTLGAVTDTTADFSWTASPDETDGYIWAVMESGDDPDMDTPVDDGTTATGVTMANASGLTPATVYDLYVQTDCGTEESTWLGPLSFTTTPLNDQCANAIMLTVGAVFADEQVVGTNTGATNDPNDPVPTCDNLNFATNGKDVWYTVVIPASGSVTVETMSNGDPGMNDTGLEIYSGTCGNITSIACNADGGTGAFSILELTGQTPGETLWVRVWGYNTNTGSFLVSAYDDTVCEMPSNLMIDDITETEIEFSWTPPADISDVDGYYWRLMNSGDDPFVDPSVDEDYVPGATSTSAMITGLTPGTDYDLYLVTVCDEVSQFVSDFMMLAVTTDEVFVCEVPTDAILVNVDANFADISWTASATETDGYEWVVMASGENPDTDTPVATGNVGTGITTATVTGLDPLTDYDFYVRTNCDPDGMSDWEGPLAFTTLDTAGVNDNSLEGFTFYPNPMVDVITINAQTEIDEVIIFSLTGQRLVDQKVGATTSQIDVSHFASGPYLMQVTTSTGKIGIYRLIKK